MSLDKKLARFAECNMGNIYGYDLKEARAFRDNLRKLCEVAGLIHIAKKRWAGQEHTEEHEDSDTVVDRLIEIIVSEMIKLEKEKHND